MTTPLKQPKQLKTKHIALERGRLNKSQNGLCAICKQPLVDEKRTPHLDHAHDQEPNPHHIRGLVHASCNTALGSLWKVLIRTGKLNALGLDGVTRWLADAAEYYLQDYSMNAYHPKKLTDLAAKFKRLNKTQQILKLQRVSITPEKKATKDQLLKLYKQYLKIL
ncbi:endonuclease domain-containing protein [Shewanella frigidimarina]|uniref:endonuclease domain-containing protein n=1 Tax=Shewanella frigidimarina TaxID=56812 RepID=UPI003D7A720D